MSDWDVSGGTGDYSAMASYSREVVDEDLDKGEDLADDYEPCTHGCDEYCEDDGCRHEHCWNCGGRGCPGYCDDYQTYNLRPDETGGAS